MLTRLLAPALLLALPAAACGQSPPRPMAPPARPVYAAPMGTAAGDFLWRLNAARARRGLHPLAYDATLAQDARRNNAIQAARGLGHFVVPPGARQCASIGGDPLTLWTNSGAHAAILFSRTARACGFDQYGVCASANVR